MSSALGPKLRRRTVLRGGLIATTLATAAAQAACSAGGSAPPVAASSAAAGRSRDAESRARVLVVFFSRAGENYHYGDRVDLGAGNTEVLAGFISARLNELGITHDVHRLEAADPYPDDYDATVARNVREQDTDARPALANPLPSTDGYDLVLVGSPIWNVRPPMLMNTFAEAHDFTGKTVHPFVTYAVSGLGTAERDYTAAVSGRRHRRGSRRPGRDRPLGRTGRGRRVAGPHRRPRLRGNARPSQHTNRPAYGRKQARQDPRHEAWR